MAGSTPYPLAILLCDQIIVDERTKKKTVVGIFDVLNAKKFPAQHRLPISIYARLTDAEGEYNFRIEYVQVNNDRLLAKGEVAPVKISDRLRVHELILEFPPIRIPEAGEYEFRIWADDRYIGRAKFAAVEVEGK